VYSTTGRASVISSWTVSPTRIAPGLVASVAGGSVTLSRYSPAEEPLSTAKRVARMVYSPPTGAVKRAIRALTGIPPKGTSASSLAATSAPSGPYRNR